MGRKKIDKIVIDRAVFMEVLKDRNISINNIAEILGISDKTIRRGFSTGINPDLLEKIGEIVNVDPEWLSGSAQKELRKLISKPENIKRLSKYSDWRTHPFDRLAQERKRIDLGEYIKGIVQKLGVTMPEYEKLYEGEKTFLETEICVLIQVALIRNLHGHEGVLNPYLTQPELIQKTNQLLERTEYIDIFDALSIKPW